MDIYFYDNYKTIIQERLKEPQVKKRNWNFRKLALHLEVQPTYLSRVMNHEDIHLSEDDLYAICKVLEFFPEEADYILLLRSYATAKRAERKKELFNKYESLRAQRKLNASEAEFSSSRLNNEMEYLLNPLCVILQVALSSETIKKEIASLPSKLGIKLNQMKDYLKILERVGIFKLAPQNPLKILEVQKRQVHFHREHPLMRTHQQLLKELSQARLSLVPEEEKQSFMATFTMNAEGFEKLKKEFQIFLKKAEQVSKESRHTEVYQLSFDLFKWL